MSFPEIIKPTGSMARDLQQNQTPTDTGGAGTASASAPPDAFDDEDDAFYNDINLPSDDQTTASNSNSTETKSDTSPASTNASTPQSSTCDDPKRHSLVTPVSAVTSAVTDSNVSSRQSLDSTVSSVKQNAQKTHNTNQNRRLSLSSKSQPPSRSTSRETKTKNQGVGAKSKEKPKENQDPKQSLLSSNYSFRSRSSSNVSAGTEVSNKIRTEAKAYTMLTVKTVQY